MENGVGNFLCLIVLKKNNIGRNLSSFFFLFSGFYTRCTLQVTETTAFETKKKSTFNSLMKGFVC